MIRTKIGVSDACERASALAAARGSIRKNGRVICPRRGLPQPLPARGLAHLLRLRTYVVTRSLCGCDANVRVRCVRVLGGSGVLWTNPACVFAFTSETRLNRGVSVWLWRWMVFCRCAVSVRRKNRYALRPLPAQDPSIRADAPVLARVIDSAINSSD